LKFKFIRDNLGYWGMKNATVSLEGSDSAQFRFTDVQLSSAVPISVPVGWSFHCSRFGSFRPLQKPEELKQNHTFTIDIRGFQMQVFMPEHTTERFAREYECVGFFTPGIWMGIVVTIMLLSVLTWGLKMIMDVKTMDRFDDPKGKPISFGSGD
jgi:V-type H+-transporting ATPase S1 subunit